MNTCRLHNPTTPDRVKMFKYAARHWAHYRCWLWAKLPEQRPVTLAGIVALLSTLHVHQLEHEFPVMVLSDVFHSYGILEKGKFPDLAVVMKAAIKLAKERK